MIPALHPQWQTLDLAEILALPTAFLPIGYSNSLLSEGGAQGAERLWERCRRAHGAVPNTVRLAAACREAGMRFVWFRYEIFRERYPATPMDEAQYRYWAEGKSWDEARKRWDADLVGEVKALMRPGDAEILYTSLGNVFIGTPLVPYLNAWGVRTVILSGNHLDWCIEQAARSARDLGYMPIVVGDTCAAGREEDEGPTLSRLNNFFAPVISTDTAIELIKKAMARRA